MESGTIGRHKTPRLTLTNMPAPAKALATCTIIALSVGMLGALGQIIVHDIIPTFYSQSAASEKTGHAGKHNESATQVRPSSEGDRGDLFADLAIVNKEIREPIYQGEQFVWTLKWTHIHIFGMSMIFIFLGAITILLNTGYKFRTWLVVLPFIGVLIDILAMWLKAFVSPAFFWLHVPGGGLFVLVFAYVSMRALREMWLSPNTKNVPQT